MHNAETLAHVAMIARTGPDAFRAHGVVEDPGTSLVTISGAVEHPGVVEVDRGTPLLDIAARATPIGPPQALLVGGYGGAWVGPAALLDALRLAVAAHHRRHGRGRHRGGARTGCVRHRESARIADYLAGQSAGQCGPCVYGLPAIADDVARLAHGQVDPALMRAARPGGWTRSTAVAPAATPTARCSSSAARSTSSPADANAHLQGAPCLHWNRPSQLRFPRPREVA